jgi:hypothetical protein
MSFASVPVDHAQSNLKSNPKCIRINERLELIVVEDTVEQVEPGAPPPALSTAARNMGDPMVFRLGD